jgi:hypothetical protein
MSLGKEPPCWFLDQWRLTIYQEPTNDNFYIDPFDPRFIDFDCPQIIYLTKDCDVYSTVDANDYQKLLKYVWHLHNDGRGRSYACRMQRLPTENGKRCNKQKRIYMHKEIMDDIPPPSEKHFLIDHKDGDGLMNTRENLRWATASENSLNVHGFFLKQLYMFGNNE